MHLDIINNLIFNLQYPFDSSKVPWSTNQITVSIKAWKNGLRLGCLWFSRLSSVRQAPKLNRITYLEHLMMMHNAWRLCIPWKKQLFLKPYLDIPYTTNYLFISHSQVSQVMEKSIHIKDILIHLDNNCRVSNLWESDSQNNLKQFLKTILVWYSLVGIVVEEPVLMYYCMILPSFYQYCTLA